MRVCFSSPILEHLDILNRWPQKSLWFHIWNHRWAVSREDRWGASMLCLGAGSQMASCYITCLRRVPSVHLSSHHGHWEGRSWQTRSVTWAASEGIVVTIGAAWEPVIAAQGTAKRCDDQGQPNLQVRLNNGLWRRVPLSTFTLLSPGKLAFCIRVKGQGMGPCSLQNTSKLASRKSIPKKISLQVSKKTHILQLSGVIPMVDTSDSERFMCTGGFILNPPWQYCFFASSEIP